VRTSEAFSSFCIVSVALKFPTARPDTWGSECHGLSRLHLCMSVWCVDLSRTPLLVDPCVCVGAVKGGGDAMARGVGSVLPHTHCTDRR
jgi:hypothetical protein